MNFELKLEEQYWKLVVSNSNPKSNSSKQLQKIIINIYIYTHTYIASSSCLGLRHPVPLHSRGRAVASTPPPSPLPPHLPPPVNYEGLCLFCPSKSENEIGSWVFHVCGCVLSSTSCPLTCSFTTNHQLFISDFPNMWASSLFMIVSYSADLIFWATVHPIGNI